MPAHQQNKLSFLQVLQANGALFGSEPAWTPEAKSSLLSLPLEANCVSAMQKLV